MGNCVVTVKDYTVSGNKQRRVGTIGLSTSYVAGGDAFTAAQFGLSTITYMGVSTQQVTGATTTGWALSPVYTAYSASGTLQAFGTGSGNLAALGEAANGDLHTTVGFFEVEGY